jgi:hypothetical protein
MARPPSLAPWQPWAAIAGFAFLLHFAWEMLQFPLFAGMSRAPHGAATWMCLRATGGDVAIALVAFATGTAAARARTWIARPSRLPFLLYLGAGVVLTLAIEAASVHTWRRWSYAPSMPMLGGFALVPLLQWIVVPLLTLWLTRRHLGLPSSPFTPTDTDP